MLRLGQIQTMSTVPASPDSLQPRAEIDAAITAGDPVALPLLREYWLADPGVTRAAFVLSRFEKLKSQLSLVPLRIAFLRSFTVEPALPILRSAAFEAGIDLTCHVGDFGAYSQDILTPSSPLYAFGANAVVLAVQSRDAAPALWGNFPRLTPAQVDAEIEETANRLVGLVRTLRGRTDAAIVVHNLQVPACPTAGVLDAQLTCGQRDAFREINRLVAAEVRKLHHAYILDYDALVARFGDGPYHDDRLWLTSRLPVATSHLPALAKEWMKFLHPLSGQIAKVLAVDLDNTLWGGVIGEDGMTGIQIGPEHPGAHYQAVQRTLLDLKARGVVLAVCSKNNPADALEAIDRHPGMLLRSSDFAVLRMNWEEKAANLQLIARELNVGIDAVALLDDNPAERRWVRSQLPQCPVLELPADCAGYARAIRDWPVFERLRLTNEDLVRTESYTQDRQRHDLMSDAATLEDFYRQLKIVVSIEPMSPATLARVAQLTQKTNQFNLTTKRYTEQQLTELSSSHEWRIYTLSSSDRFGPNGLVALAIVQAPPPGREWEIDTLLMSCRVIGRTIETALLAALCEAARSAGATTISGWFIPTIKNAPAAGLYESHGFTKVASDGDRTRWSLEIGDQATPIACPEWIDMRVTA